jgi:hypothetical protein
MDNEKLPFYVLIRTSNRPKFFAEMMASIKAQTHPNIITITHTDDPSDTYVTGDIIVSSKRIPKSKQQTGPYNLYNNKLLQAIPDGPGYYHFIDDDDKYYDSTVIEKAVAKCQENKINIVRSMRWSGTVWPKKWGAQQSYQTECFILHTKHRNLAKWWDRTGGDHNYSRQITKVLPINWIDGIIIARAQEGKGHGRRYDLGQQREMRIDPRTGTAEQNKTLIDVLFRVCVRFPQECKGREGEVKKIPAWRAKMLEELGRVTIGPSQEEIIKAREILKHRMPLTEAAFQKMQNIKKKK